MDYFLFFFFFFYAHYNILCVKMFVWIKISVHQWVHLSVVRPTLFHSDQAKLKCCTLCIQMQHWSFICWSAYDRGSVYRRQRADWFDLCFFFSNTRCLSHLVWQTQRCGMLCARVLSIHGSKKHCPWMGQAEVDRLYWTVCHRPGRGEKDRWEETARCILMVSLWNKQQDGERVG